MTRSYSFSNAPHEEILTFLVKLTPGGAMSTYLTDRAAVGDDLTFTGPHGSFFLREAEQPVLLLAGGTGLAPILAMLRKLRADGSHRRAHLVYGVSTDEDLVELETLAEVATGLPGFSWDYCVADPASSAPNKGPEKAYVMSLIRPEHLYDGDVAMYLCGPPPMVEAVRKHVADGGIEPTGFYYEKFALAVPQEAPAEPVAAEPKPAAPREELLVAADARAVTGQVLFPGTDLGAWTGAVTASHQGDVMRRIAGQLVAPAGPGTGAVTPLDEDDVLVTTGGRRIAGQDLFPAVAAPEPVVTPPTPTPAPATVAADGYQIGEEHPAVHESDAIFEAREALELGALELTMGRLSSQQLAGYRLLAESTLPYVEGDRFVDAAQYTETNAAFHDYLFTLTGNDHLLQAYRALGVKGRMSEVLRNATWCHPLCAQDHVDIVEAFAAGDRETGRALIAAHADRSKQTMRRAMVDTLAARRPKFITPRRFAGKVVLVTGAAQGIGEQTAQRISAERRDAGPGRPLRGGQGTRRRAGHRRTGRAGGHRRPGTLARRRSPGAASAFDVWPDRRADQQRGRGHQLQTVHGVHRHRDPRGGRPLADDHAVRLPRGAAVDGGARRGRDRQRVVGGHPRDQPHPVLGGQGRHQRDHRLTCTRVRRCRNPRRRNGAGRNPGTAATDFARHAGADQRHRAGLVPGAHRPDHRFVTDEALRHPRRTGSRDLLPGF